MAAIAKIDASQGDITLVLRAERAHPIKGVLSSRDAGHIEPTAVDDESTIVWRLPLTNALYVTYGIVLPLKDVWFAPSYRRLLIQGDVLLHSAIANPRRFRTEQHADGEWVGPPEAFRIVMQEGGS